MNGLEGWLIGEGCVAAAQLADSHHTPVALIYETISDERLLYKLKERFNN